MDQPASFHRKSINNTMVSNNSKSHSTSLIKKNPMITRTSTTQTSNQIQVLMLKSKLIQTLPWEKPEPTTKPQTMLFFPEDHIWSKPTLEKPLSEKFQTDGKETQIILVQPRSQYHKPPLHHLMKSQLANHPVTITKRLKPLFKNKIQTLLSEKLEITLTTLTTPTYQEDQFSLMLLTVQML